MTILNMLFHILIEKLYAWPLHKRTRIGLIYRISITIIGYFREIVVYFNYILQFPEGLTIQTLMNIIDFNCRNRLIDY